MANAIDIKNLIFKYNSKRTILDDISISIEQGEYVTLLGRNGSGKSTLSKILVGLLEANSGNITINDLELNEKTIDSIREHVGIVFQNPDNQFFGITVKDDIAFGLENRCVPVDEMEKTILKFAKLVHMEDYLDCNPEELSGGQKQRVAIAGVLAFNPDIIILDEATSMLDPAGTKEVLDTINSLYGTKTIISITHDLNEAIKSDRVIVLNQGKIVLDGKPSEVFKETKILKECNLDITNSLELIDLVKDSNIKYKKEVEDLLWELTFKR